MMLTTLTISLTKICLIAHEWFRYLKEMVHAISYFLHWKISIVHRLQHLFLLSTFYKWKATFIFTEGLYGSIELPFLACVDEEVQGDKELIM